MSYFAHLTKAPSDSILGLILAFKNDNRPNKVNLGVGAYQDEKGNPQVLSAVRKAEALLLTKHLDKEYPSIQGNPLFIEEMLSLIFGKEFCQKKEKTLFGLQTIGGTGALRTGAEFLTQQAISSIVYLSDPTWPNHALVFGRAGMKLETYPYYSFETKTLDFSGMCHAIEKMKPCSTIVLQPCCHNPTGLTPSLKEWKILSSLIKKKGIIPFFDLAYQGFDKGIEEDASIIRYFAEQGHEMFVASSCSKNFGLYGERVGFLAVVCAEKDVAKKAESQICLTIRGSYSMPPLQGARIVSTILSSPELKKEWEEELITMRRRIKEMRKALAEGLMAEKHFSVLLKQTGMFSYTGLSQKSVETLQNQYAIYMPSSGRINIAGLNPQNLSHVIESILAVTS